MKLQIKDLLVRTKRAVLNNFLLKLISVLMAFTLWFIVTGGTKMEETIQVRHGLERFVPDGWAIAAPMDRELELHVRGRDDSVIRLLDPGEVSRLVTINIDPGLIQPKKGVQRIELNANNVSLPSGVEVLDVRPSTVLMQIDSVISREKPVRVAVTGEPREGYRLNGEPVVEPAVVTVTGAQQIVDSIREILAEVSLDDRGMDDGVAAVTLRRIPLLNYSENAVEVALDIVEINETRAFTIDASNFDFRDGADRLSVDVDPMQIVLNITGPTSWINELRPGEIRIMLDRDLVENLDRRTPITFRSDLVVFSRPARSDLVEIRANPNDFHVIVSSR